MGLKNTSQLLNIRKTLNIVFSTYVANLTKITFMRPTYLGILIFSTSISPLWITFNDENLLAS